ncbi:DUF362 domain-containing protein, partial [bacterium]|nr:DUF362 domain-containing protein [bacterium]
MARVYFWPVTAQTETADIQRTTRAMLERLLADGGIEPEKRVPLKVHFGEKGNSTYIKGENYQGIIDLLKERGCQPYYTETSVLYAGERYAGERHIKVALEHGFDQLPIEMADGQEGEDFCEIPVGQKHFESCYIGRGIAEAKQLIVLSHFKGHMLAGFGGAIKQLSMGCAARAGKLAMHAGVKPRIKSRSCRRCHVCEKRCNFGALHIGEKSYIDQEKCRGCGACVAACPHKAIRSFSFFSWQSIVNILFRGSHFREGLAEYAYAASRNKQCFYVSFAMNITKGCDCDPRRMKPVIPDIGVFASLDPVSIDAA